MWTRTASLLLCASLSLTQSSFPRAAGAQAQSAGPSFEGIAVKSLPHPRTNVRWGRATGLVAAPFPEVVGMVEDYARYHTFLPHFRTSRVLSQRGNKAIVYMEAVVAMGTLKLWAQMKMGPVKSQGSTQAIEAKMMSGNMKYLEARWELTPIDAQRTHVVFQLLIEPKLPLPASLLSNENAKASRQTIAALRRSVAAQRSKTANL